MAATVIRKRISRYTVNATPEGWENHLWEISVEASSPIGGTVLWVVRWMGQCLNRDGGWDLEPIPSSRTEAWLKAHRFDLETALRLAEAAAPDVEVNGVKARDV